MEIDVQQPTQPSFPILTTSRRTVWLVVIAAIGIIGLWLLGTPSGVHGKANAVGYAICHRISDRSLSAFGHQLPLCARCTGIYMGVMTGLGIMVASGRSRVTKLPTWQVGTVLGLFVVILGIDGVNSYLHLFPNFEGGLYEPNNTLRLITGVFTGLTLINLVYPIFNATVWQHQDTRRAVENLKELAGYCLIATLVIAATLTRQAHILLFFGLLSAVGVLLVLTIINGVMIVALLKRERSYQRWQELWLPMLAGLTVAIILIGGIDAVRYAITGTWEGFVFPQ
jgi:uncharacterized membrane protein